MELREYIAIFNKYQKTFLITLVLCVTIGVGTYVLQPVRYATEVMLNVTRKGVQQTTDYRYDDFYRLQADEKFGETIVEWLKNPRIATDIYSSAGMAVNDLSLKHRTRIFKSEKL